MPQFSAESPIKVGSYQTSTGFTAVVTDINLEARTPFPVWGYSVIGGRKMGARWSLFGVNADPSIIGDLVVPVIIDGGNEGDMAPCVFPTYASMAAAINSSAAYCHKQSADAGWWDEPREKGTLLCLIHSEISEAMEGERKGLMDEHLPYRKMAEVELADAVIRIFDYAAGHGYDLGGALVEKLEYNKNREDHKRENRALDGGKKF